METKQKNIKAVIAKPTQNGSHNDKPTIDTYIIVDKATERRVVTCRVYMSASRNASTVYASMWANSGNVDVSGSGKASGYGYHKASAAIDCAIRSAGVELYGTPYTNPHDEVDFSKRASISGVGDSAVESALLAIAHALGYNDVIFVHA